MQEYIKYNLHHYLRKDAKKYTFLWVIPICLFLLLVGFAYKRNAYDVLEVKGQTICNEECTIEFFYPTESFLYEFVKINHKKYEIQEVLFGEPVLDRYNTSIQNITLKLKEYKGKNNEFVVLDIFKNKESLLKKIAKIIKER